VTRDGVARVDRVFVSGSLRCCERDRSVYLPCVDLSQRPLPSTQRNRNDHQQHPSVCLPGSEFSFPTAKCLDARRSVEIFFPRLCSAHYSRRWRCGDCSVICSLSAQFAARHFPVAAMVTRAELLSAVFPATASATTASPFASPATASECAGSKPPSRPSTAIGCVPVSALQALLLEGEPAMVPPLPPLPVGVATKGSGTSVSAGGTPAVLQPTLMLSGALVEVRDG